MPLNQHILFEIWSKDKENLHYYSEIVNLRILLNIELWRKLV